MTTPGDAVEALLAAEDLPAGFQDTVDRAIAPLAARIAEEASRLGRPMVVGLCGAQGSGKSTFAAFLEAILAAWGLRAAALSIDDLYLTHAARQELARTRHPLFVTRGPPGTHDIPLGLRTLDALTRAGPAHPVRMPRFDKATDTRTPDPFRPQVLAPVDVVLFEGWLVGARPEPPARLRDPVNALERDEDADGRWRTAANRALAEDYPALFARIDLLVLLRAPEFEQVRAWRGLQEEKLARRLRAEGRAGAPMDAGSLARFVMHYERLTRWILEEMPSRAGVVIELGPDHAVRAVLGL